jgi:hypothetical protein
MARAFGAMIDVPEATQMSANTMAGFRSAGMVVLLS